MRCFVTAFHSATTTTLRSNLPELRSRFVSVCLNNQPRRLKTMAAPAAPEFALERSVALR